MSALRRLYALRRERPLFVGVAAVTLLALAAYPVVDWWLRTAGVAPTYRYWDFGAYRIAVSRWHAGEPIYWTGDDPGYHGSYLYPPIALLLFVPLQGLEPGLAVQVWNLGSVAVLWLGLQAAVAGLGYDLRWYERGGLLWLLAGFQPVLLSMKLAQLGPLMGGLLSFALAGVLADDRQWAGALAGACTAVVGVVKLAYAPVGAHLLADRRRFAGAVAAGAALVVASLLIFGVETHRTYLDVLAWGAGRGADARPPTLWLPPYYRPLHWLPGTALLRGIGSLVVAGYALASDAPDALVFALGVAAFPLLTPLAYTYYFVALLPAVLVLLRTELGRDGYPALPLVGLLLVQFHSYGLKLVVDVLAGTVPLLDLLAPYWVLQPGLWGNAILFGLAMVRVAGHVSLPEASRDALPG